MRMHWADGLGEETITWVTINNHCCLALLDMGVNINLVMLEFADKCGYGCWTTP